MQFIDSFICFFSFMKTIKSTCWGHLQIYLLVPSLTQTVYHRGLYYDFAVTKYQNRGSTLRFPYFPYIMLNVQVESLLFILFCIFQLVFETYLWIYYPFNFIYWASTIANINFENVLVEILFWNKMIIKIRYIVITSRKFRINRKTLNVYNHHPKRIWVEIKNHKTQYATSYWI